MVDTETEEGELRKLIRVAKLMLADGSSEIDTDKILNLNDDDIDVILESLVMKATIKSELYNVEGLVINETHPDFYWDDRYEGGVRIDGELRKLLKAAPLIIETKRPTSTNSSTWAMAPPTSMATRSRYSWLRGSSSTRRCAN